MPGALVRYGGKRMAPMLYANPYAKRARIAYAVGSYAYRHRGTAIRAARTIGRAYRRYRRRRPGTAKRARMNRVGERVGRGGSKRFTTADTNAVLRTTRQLQRREMTAIPGANLANNIDERQRDIINLRGFKACWEVRNTSSVPLHLNMAVLAAKEGADADIPNEGFFRGTGSTRGIDFSNNLNSNDFSCRPINADKYTVFTHKRWLLNPQGEAAAGDQNEVGTSFMSLKQYFPIRRQIRYRTNADTDCETKIYLVWWCDQFQTDTGTAPVSDAIQMSERYITYFREPKN